MLCAWTYPRLRAPGWEAPRALWFQSLVGAPVPYDVWSNLLHLCYFIRSDGQARPSEDPETLFALSAGPWLRWFLAFVPSRVFNFGLTV